MPENAILKTKVTLKEALALLPGLQGQRFAPLLRKGSFEIEIYAPRGTDSQQPHTRDEVYIVLEGKGEFLNGGDRQEFQPHDLLYVPAGVEHKFENFTDDLIVLAIFYGSEHTLAHGPAPES